jgi:four helix bundle protein
VKNFRDLKVWQINQDCVRQSLSLIHALPNDFGFQHIAKQLFRATSSIGANLAEGQSSYEGKEFIRYINIALHSAVECDHWLATLENLYEGKIDIKPLQSSNLEVIKMLRGLRNSIEEKRY